MSRNCSVCDHPQRRDIDAALVAGRSSRDIAAEYGLNYQAIRRHRLNHLPIAIRAAARAALDSAVGTETAEQAQIPATPILEAAEGISDDLARADREEAPAAPETAPAPVRTRQRTRGIQLEETPPAPPVSPAPAGQAGSATPAPAGVFDLYQGATDLRERAMAILAAAEQDRDAKTALMAIREARGVLDHLSRLEERQGGNAAAVPLVDSPEWARTRAAIITALADHPEARLAVAEALVATGALS